jgi:uncharacterized protein YidB (DUF937 family)
MMMNPMQMIQMLQSSGNPMQAMMNMANQNPMLRNAIQMMNGKTPQQMEQTVRQIAQQRGVDLDQLAHQMGVRLPK